MIYTMFPNSLLKRRGNVEIWALFMAGTSVGLKWKLRKWQPWMVYFYGNLLLVLVS
jgi:hypothetical protein